MPIAFHANHPSLKRPRSTSQPPSPSSSSPKRAASDSDDHFEPTNSLLGHNMDMSSTGRASSPLREHDSSSGEWVKRTEDVHLNEIEDQGNERYKQLYNDFLASIPPPFLDYHTYFIIPKTFERDLKALALSDAETKTEATPTDLQLDMTGLVETTEADQVHIIQSSLMPDGSRALGTEYRKAEPYWTLRDGLVEDDDFLFIHEDGWEKIMECLGNYDGPRLPRYCLRGGSIQLKPPIFTLYAVEPASREQPAVEALSSAKPFKVTCPTTTSLAVFLGLVKKVVVEHMTTTTPPKLVRVWQLDLPSQTSESSDTLPALGSFIMPHTLLLSVSGSILPYKSITLTSTVDECGLVGGDGIAVEIGKMGPFEKEIWSVDINDKGKAVEKGKMVMPPVPSAPPPLFSKPPLYGGNNDDASGSSSSRIATRSQSRQPEKRGKGLVGLTNLGNTCFMNSAVQCLSNTRELSEYFLSGVYREELNPDNPLGMHGLIAKTFGQTVESLWTSSGSSSFSPRFLKQQTSRFAPQFAGYGQHDTQEFIAFLLDGLHEDLNRIHKKPYIEKPDWKAGGDDKQLADLGKECWDGYKKRNDSVIVDLFQGQLQSTLVCPECSKESITLDPFMYLTVPLPIAQHRAVKVKFVPRDPDQPPVTVRLLISQNASFQQLKERLAGMMKVNPAHLVGFDLWKGQIYNWWCDADHNSEFKDADEAVWHDVGVPISSSKRSVGAASTDGSVTLPVYTYKAVDPNHLPSECSLQPFFITLSKTEATDPSAVREAIMLGYHRFVRDSVKSQLFVSSSSSHAAVPVPAEEDELAEENGGSSQHAEHMEVDSPAQPPRHQPHLSPTILQRKHGSSTSLSSLTSIRSHKPSKLVPRGDLFKVHVADSSAADRPPPAFGMNMFKSKDNLPPPLFKASLSDASKVFSPLENRLKIKKGMFGRFTSGLGNMMSSSTSSAAGESEAEADSTPSTPNSPQPVVRPGEGIFVEWTYKKFTEYFDTTYVPETIIDPAIEVEQRKKKEGKVIDIEDCLDEFSKEETLGQDDLWYCPVCKKHQAASKKLEIYKAPDILVICIKRFGSSRRLSDKLDNLVNFPIEGLDLEERVSERRIAKSLDLSDEECRDYGIEPTDEPLVYDLYAVDNHFGGMGGGHYTAFCKNKVDNQWYNYDDSRVSPATEKSVQSRAAYLLFYRRRSNRPIGGVSRIKAQEASRAVSPELDTETTTVAAVSSSSSSSSSSSPGRPSHQLPTYRQTIQDGPLMIPPGLPTPPSSDDDIEPTVDGEGDGWPSYSTPPEASPNVSDSEVDRELPAVDLKAVGTSLGFGNTAWGNTGSSSFQRPVGVNHSFGTRSGSANGDSGDMSQDPTGDDGATSTTTTNTTDTETNTDAEADASGNEEEVNELLGGGYQVVDKTAEGEKGAVSKAVDNDVETA